MPGSKPGGFGWAGKASPGRWTTRTLSGSRQSTPDRCFAALQYGTVPHSGNGPATDNCHARIVAPTSTLQLSASSPGTLPHCHG